MAGCEAKATPAVAVAEGWVWMANRLAAPAISRSKPKLAPEAPTSVAVPELVMLPPANGVPAMGRTRIFCQVNLFGVAEGLLLTVTEMLIAVAVTVAEMVEPLAVLLILRVAVESPFTRTATAAVVSKTSPLGAFRMMVPVLISPPFAS